MVQSVIIVGAGIIGAAAAFRLAKAGLRVTVLDAGHAAATPASFGWVNASYFLDDAHLQLRLDGMAAYRTLMAELEVPLRWTGSILWEQNAANTAELAAKLKSVAYPVEELSGKNIKDYEPALAVYPEYALRLAGEGVADSPMLAKRLLAAAQDHGARVLRGVNVTAIASHDGGACEVLTPLEQFAADKVLIAAGAATGRLLAGIDVALPTLSRPGVMVCSKPIASRLNHVIAAPDQEIRQDDEGRLLLPASPNHQADESTHVIDASDMADAACQRAAHYLGARDLNWSELTVAQRPMPSDGRPVIGGTKVSSVFVAVMHSGVTLAAIAAEIIAAEMQEQPDFDNQAAQLAHFRVARFS